MIDPLRLVAQQEALRRETACATCGRRTTDRTGTCLSCRKLATGIRWDRMTLGQLTGIMDRARKELHRRRDELTRAIGDREDAP
jgi:hypothetical protein